MLNNLDNSDIFCILNVEKTKDMPYKDKEKRKQYLKEWNKKNKERVKEYKKERREDGHFSVYLLPNENYVGQTKSIKSRMYRHKYHGRDTTDYKVLHTFDTREEALQKEAEYHAQGYNG